MVGFRPAFSGEAVRALKKGDRVRALDGCFCGRVGHVCAFFPEVPSYQVWFRDAETDVRVTYFRHNLRALPRPQPQKRKARKVRR
jgi:hypothetical protein